MPSLGSYRPSGYTGDIASIAEDSHGHLEVSHEQHLRNIRKAALGHYRRRNSDATDAAVEGKQCSNVFRSAGARERTHSSDTPHSNVKIRLANLSKLIRSKGNNGYTRHLQQADNDYQLSQSWDVTDRSPQTGRQKNRSTEPSYLQTIQAVGDNGSVNSSVAVESIANMTEASLDTVKISNISEKVLPPSELISGGNKKISVVKQWNKFKRLMGVKPSIDENLQQSNGFGTKIDSPFSSLHSPRERANTDDTKSSNTRSNISPWRRVRSDGSSSATSSNFTGRSNTPLEYQRMDTKTKHMMDDRIRGRLDGVDMFSLGPAPLIPNTTISAKESKAKNMDDDFVLPALLYTFTGNTTKLSNSDIVSSMLWSSGGCYPPEIILDGICPGPDGRWIVRFEQQYFQDFMPGASFKFIKNGKKEKILSSNSQNRNFGTETVTSIQTTCNNQNGSHRSISPGPPSLQHLSSNSDECDLTSEVPTIPLHVLQKQLWGPEIGPADLTNLDDEAEAVLLKNSGQDDETNDDSHSSSYNTEDPLLSLAAKCSIPIDVDEDIFIISTRDHINSIHEIASTSISKGRFAVALRVLETLLKGLNALKYTDSTSQTDKEESDLRFAKGATMHNIGILQLWLGQYSTALTSFSNAVIERQNLLPKNHPDICVSLVRQATATFALDQLEDSRIILEHVLTMLPSGHSIRAKVLNNLAVVYLRLNSASAALKEFTRSLEMQRLWLDAPVKRPCTVYDAALTLSNMGYLYLERHDFDLALYLYEEALLFQTSIFRKEHESVLETLTSLAIAKVRNGEIDNGIQILQGCLRSRSAKHGKNSSHAIQNVGLLGLLFTQKQSYEESLQCITQVRKWQKLNLSPTGHPALKESRELIRALESALFSRSSNAFGIRSNSTTGNGVGSYGPKVWV